VTILIWALAVAGSALILTQSSIMSPIRDALAGAEKRLFTLRIVFDLSRTADVHVPDDDSGNNWKRLPRAMRWPVAAAHRAAAALSKLATCPMCSGFWLGAFWTRVLLAAPWVDSAHPRAPRPRAWSRSRRSAS
jgi:hypothetical protein